MKRFFATVGFSFVFSLLLLNHFISEFVILYIIVTTAFSAVSLLIKSLRKHKEIPCIFLSLALSAVIFSVVTELSYKPQLELNGEMHDFEATVIDTPTISSGGNYSYLIKTKSIDGEKKKIRMRLYTPYNLGAAPYDEIEFSSKPFVPGENMGTMGDYFKSKRTYLAAYTKFDVSVHVPEKKPFISFFYLRKAQSEKNIRRYLDGDYAEFAISLLFGDKTYLSEETKDSFSVSGVSHIMAVSGLHMSVWVMGLYFILRKLRFDKRVSGFLGILACVSLVLFCAFSVSVIRACIMMSVYFSASFFKRKGDSLNSLGLAAFIICAVNPFAVCDVSFLLSFFATLGIIVFSDMFPFLFSAASSEKLISKMGRAVLSAACVSIAAALFTFPVIMKYYSSVTPYSVLGNIAVFFAVPPCLLLSGALSVFPSLTFAAYPVKAPLIILEKYIFGAVNFVSSLPLSRIISESVAVKLILPMCLVSAFFVLYSVKKKRISPSAILVAFSLVLITVFRL